MNQTKLIRISLNASVPASYKELARVPADITSDEIALLLRERWAAVGGDEFEVEEEGFEQGVCCATDAGDGEVPNLIVTRVGDCKLKVDEVSAVPDGAEQPSGDALPQFKGVYIHQDEDLHTIIAALRFWQQSGMADPLNRSDEMQDIATNSDEVTSLSDEDIDLLVDALNVHRDPAAFRAQLDGFIS